MFVAYKKSTHLSIVALIINLTFFAFINILLMYFAYRFMSSLF